MEITNKRFSVKIALFAKFNEIIQRERKIQMQWYISTISFLICQRLLYKCQNALFYRMHKTVIDHLDIGILL